MCHPILNHILSSKMLINHMYLYTTPHVYMYPKTHNYCNYILFDCCINWFPSMMVRLTSYVVDCNWYLK